VDGVPRRALRAVSAAPQDGQDSAGQVDASVSLSAGSYASFVIRVWGTGHDLMHGQITNTATGRTVRFRTPQRMVTFILAHLRTVAGGETAEHALSNGAGERVPT
jgi:hypothetical protein